IRHSFPLYPGIAGLAVLFWNQRPHRQEPAPADRTGSRRVLVGLLVLWLAVKLVFVHGVVPARNRNRQPREKAGQIAALVPPTEILYLSKLKDEGIMFYYGRTVRRVANPAQLISSAGASYCILDEAEWTALVAHRPTEALLHL